VLSLPGAELLDQKDSTAGRGAYLPAHPYDLKYDVEMTSDELGSGAETNLINILRFFGREVGEAMRPIGPIASVDAARRLHAVRVLCVSGLMMLVVSPCASSCCACDDVLVLSCVEFGSPMSPPPQWS
jgi:hypothetical protein